MPPAPTSQPLVIETPRAEAPVRTKSDPRMEDSAKIGTYMRALLDSYESLRGRTPDEAGVSFWDLVVVSAGDASQEGWYEAQLQLKQEAGELPKVPFLCVADPPGPRVGSGGSTLHILALLEAKYPGKLDQWKVLILHAGGYSKRLPSHSCSGKIFSPLPIVSSGHPYQMLDLKLALYLPFLQAMEPGVFIAASDTIETFCLSPDMEGGRGETITALAHPSSLFIGSTHGVYVMPGQKISGLQELKTCQEVLQKPSEQLMRERGAVLDKEGTEVVYSDSAFWFHTPTTKKLIELHSNVGKTLTTELCIYGDLLTCLGTRHDKDYVEKLNRREMDLVPGVVERRSMQKSIGGTSLGVLAMHCSSFHHLGTTQEYLHGLTSDPHLRLQLDLGSVVCSKVANSEKIKGIVLQSALSQPVEVPSNSIVEYSVIEAKVNLGPKTILSSVHITEEVDLAAGFLYHTVPIVVSGNTAFVTVAFHHSDDMKASAERSNNLSYAGGPLTKLHPKIALSSEGPASLWNARLFPAHPSMASSLAGTANMLAELGKPKIETSKQQRLYSMEDLVEMKDGAGILNFRKKLTNLCRT